MQSPVFVDVSYHYDDDIRGSSQSYQVVLAAVVALTVAAPGYTSHERSYSDNSFEFAKILRDDRHQEDDGAYNMDVETDNGIVLAESGSPSAPGGAVIMAGQYSYTAPDGTLVVVKYVADENGYQPFSDLLPVSPEFPHPIPDFVLEQIRRAAEEDARYGSYSDESNDSDDRLRSYSAP
ncbi:hypothetical protein Pcinc_038966 [Petrolisthes cinctipes]|uniref:Uncharacterized protein n=1 Tax=Petrolisthes cinctipes TaxID=88211 RepID=A0AAE1EJX6_PETCI|nr:hypothetical protein Pcinc_038966 [Petrolisthes cinctipes]